RDAPHRGAVPPLRGPPRPCVPRRAPADAAALLHQLGEPRLRAGEARGVAPRPLAHLQGPSRSWAPIDHGAVRGAPSRSVVKSCDWSRPPWASAHEASPGLRRSLLPPTKTGVTFTLSDARASQDFR